MNKAILTGNLTKDPELRKTQSNKSVVNFTLAINDGYGDKKTTEYIDVVAWESLAETIANYCSKGKKLMVEGKIRIEDKEYNGQKRRSIYVVASEVEFLSPRSEKPEARNEQTTLNDGRTDIHGRNTKVTIESDELPFY